MLGSWEERLEATLIGIGFNTIYLPVERPPEEYETALRVAAEHFAFCSDTGPAWTGHHSAARRGARRRSCLVVLVGLTWLRPRAIPGQRAAPSGHVSVTAGCVTKMKASGAAGEPCGRSGRRPMSRDGCGLPDDRASRP